MLSDRAQKYLAGLKRLPAVPTEDIEQIFKNYGFPCFPIWLDFHERYAGYVEDMGADRAIWGIVHEKPQFFAPREPFVDSEIDKKTWYVMCADVHPSYEYLLDQTGEFVGQAESFDIYVERLALFQEFYTAAKKTERILSSNKNNELLQQIRAELEHHFVPTGSDKFRRYYMNDQYLLEEDAETGRVRQVRKHL